MPAEGGTPVPHRALVFAGGDALPRAVASVLPTDALVIAADSGVDRAHSLGRRVDLAVGDLDSVSPTGLERAEREGAGVERYPAEKDATDLELALDAAVARSIEHVTVVGGHGGRLDHLFGNLMLLASPKYAALDVDAWVGVARVVVVRAHAALEGPAGSTVSLFAVHGPAHGVSTRDLRFPLHDATLEPGSTLGLSNEIVGLDAGVEVADGVLLAVQPDALADLDRRT
jgi:thiamine pyrophosphokinase